MYQQKTKYTYVCFPHGTPTRQAIWDLRIESLYGEGTPVSACCVMYIALYIYTYVYIYIYMYFISNQIISYHTIQNAILPLTVSPPVTKATKWW